MGMIPREPWQALTIGVLEQVLEERKRQMAKHGEAMRALPDGTGPSARWVAVPGVDHIPAAEIQRLFRAEYEEAASAGRLTRMHLVREELAEAFECEPGSQEFVDEILQVAALCVQWAEYAQTEQLSSRKW